MATLTSADFPAFFQALWKRPAFDWQTRLVTQVRDKSWPSTLNLPTGSGKTATLDIALFALALDAFEEPERRRQPRRVVLVVDRRVVVDQAYERAVRLAQALAEARDGILREVARALRRLQSDRGALPVMPAILRGGMPRESEWARSPDQPVLLVSTVDQVGSRLLFRGYGVSDRMKPIHAGLLGRDSLFLLDEVHLSRPFEQTLAAVTHYAGAEHGERTLPRPVVTVRMSATVADPPDDTFGLTSADRAAPVLAKRLASRKRAQLIEVKTPKDPGRAREEIAKACIKQAERLASGSACVIAVIVNRVDTARRAAALAQGKAWDNWDVQLMTGRMRLLDRADLQADFIRRIRAGRKRTGERILLVSTQAVEAGADFDFDALVTECASLDALRQRFGRLDRLGELGTTDAAVVAASGDIDDSALPDAVYGEALGATWHWLTRQPEPASADDNRVLDFGIRALDATIDGLDRAVLASMVAPRPVAPVLTSSHLDRWVQTSPIPSADPDVAPFLHGTERGAPDVHLVWRADVEDALRVVDAAFLKSALAAVPPSALEALSIPIWAARTWLAAVAARQRDQTLEPVPAVADVEGEVSPAVEEPDDLAVALAWRGDDTVVVSSPGQVRPGDTLVVPSSYGGLSPHFYCWDPASTEPVRDRGDEAQLLQRGRAVLRWNPLVLAGAGLNGHLARGPKLDADDFEEDGAAAERRAVEEWRAAALAQDVLPPWLRLAIESLGPSPRVLRLGDTCDAWRMSWRAKRLPAAEVRRVAGLPFLTPDTPADGSATEGDAGSFANVEVLLERHLSGVERFARRFGEAVALPTEVVTDIALAARLHDVGKADPRFQLMLHGGDPVAQAMASELLAKSAVPMRDRAARDRARTLAGYPTGTRHEVTSVALARENDDLRALARDWSLVLYLIASHHGWCRPFAPPAPDQNPVWIEARLDGTWLTASSDHGLGRIDSGLAEQFWKLVRRYGWWGLAWLEAIVRLADHRESELEGSHV